MTTLLTSMTRTNPGAGSFPWVETYLFASSDLVVGTVVANRAYVQRTRVDNAIRVTKARWYVGVASGNVDVGIYSFDGTTATLLASTGATAAAGTSAYQEANLTAAFTFQPGVDYWIFFMATDGATFTTQRVGGTVTEGATVDTSISRFYKAAAGNSLAASYTSFTASSATIWAKFLP